MVNLSQETALAGAIPACEAAVRENEGPSGPAALAEMARVAVDRTQRYYIGAQHRLGYWWYELESNVSITAEYLMMLRFMGLRDPVRDKKIMNHILRSQRPDGTWALYKDGRGDLSITVEAYFALKLAGVSAKEAALTKARAFILDSGGVEAARVFTKIYLSLFSQFSWSAIPSAPVEMNLLPLWMPFNIYGFSSWARSTLVPLSLILEKKPSVKVPEGMGVAELYRNPGTLPPLAAGVRALSWKGAFLALDSVLKVMERAPVRPLRKRAMKNTERWVLDHQEPSGDWGGIQPAMVNSVLALHALGYAADSDPVRKGLESLEAFTIEKEDELVLQSCVSPVWDTALSSLALINSGLSQEHPSLERAAAWLASKQILKKGDWSKKRPGLEPGGWAFEFDNSWYPDVDDTAVVLLFLDRYAKRGVIRRETVDRGINWVLGMQGRDGGWGAFDADNDTALLNHLPFGDLEAMIDPSTPDLTGRVLELLGRAGYSRRDRAVKRAVSFIRRTQEKDGPWWGRWGVNYTYGTAAVLSGLNSVGEDMKGKYVQDAVSWIKSSQNNDCGWGESCESYTSGRKTCSQSTPSQTAWALLGLMAAGEGGSDEALTGVRYLIERQRPDGTWDEEPFTGTGFPKHFYIRYHNYRNCFPLMALGKFISSRTGDRCP